MKPTSNTPIFRFFEMIELEDSPVIVPFNRAFKEGSPEYEAIIQAHIKRVEAEMPQSHDTSGWSNHTKKRIEKKKRPRKQYDADRSKMVLLKERSYDSIGGKKLQDVKVCNCGYCRKLLLGESEVALVDELRESGKNKVLKKLPPLVAGRDKEGRPLCQECKMKGQ